METHSMFYYDTVIDRSGPHYTRLLYQLEMLRINGANIERHWGMPAALTLLSFRDHICMLNYIRNFQS